MFNAPRLSFARRQAVPREGCAVPPPLLGKAGAKRFAQLAEARELVARLPDTGEGLFLLLTGRFDYAHLLAVILDKLGCVVERMRVSTLSMNERSLSELLAMVDSGKVLSLDLLVSKFYRSHNPEVFERAKEEFGKRRGLRLAAARCHCKVTTLALTDGRRYSLEGSANVRSNSSWEQCCMFQDANLVAWHDAWIEQLVTTHEGDEGTD